MVASTLTPADSLRALRLADLQDTRRRTFCQKVNDALDEDGFDTWLKGVCGPYLIGRDEPSPISVGMYFRMTFIAYLRENGYPIHMPPDGGTLVDPNESLEIGRAISSRNGHTLGCVNFRFPLEVHRRVFEHAVGIVAAHGLLRNSGSTGIVHKETGDDWTDSVATAAGCGPSTCAAART
jgi:hypothetical protein